MDFREFLRTGFVVLDGATGSNLQMAGMKSGDCPEEWIVRHADIFTELQKKYIEAGSDVLYTPTFTCNRIKLREYGLEDRQAELTGKLAELTHEAVRQSGTQKKIYVAGDISMTGQQLEPVGSLPFEELVDIYKEEAALLLPYVDFFVIETMMSLQECRAAVLAVKETCDLPVMVTLTYQPDGRTLYGTSPETALVVLQAMGADAVGINCSTGPEQMVPALRAMAKYAKVPLVAKPNAGLPILSEGVTKYDMGPEEFAEAVETLVEAGATVLGGCCGTTPEHIKALRDKLNSLYPGGKSGQPPFQAHDGQGVRALTTERDVTPIPLDGSFLIIGERINPTGKKDLQAELKEGRLDLVLSMAEEQAAAPAQILDVNMGMSGIDEGAMMQRVVKELTMTVDLPLCIDSSHVDVVENALRIYPGRALINSISLEREKMERLLPVAKKYGSMFILLPLSEAGLPKDLEEKKLIIQKIVSGAKRQGLCEEDIIVDGLVGTAGANKKAALEVLDTISYCREELHLATVCGLSNISFGLPERVFLNTAFLTLAIGRGLTMAIANPSQTLLTNAALAADLLLAKEGADMRYIQGVSPAVVTQSRPEKPEEEKTGWHPLYEAVVKGRKGNILKLVEEALGQGEKPTELINTELIPAINYVGELFEKKKYFLPQLIASAETMEKAIGRLEPLLEAERGGEKLATIVVATVKGDIHDIGKNLVVLMLKNHGFEVIDMGKDVEAQDILDKARETGAQFIGLSALMTTTMMEMRHVIELAKEQGVTAKILVGGAVVTEDFAKEIGADGYSADANEAVKLVKRLLACEVGEYE